MRNPGGDEGKLYEPESLRSQGPSFRFVESIFIRCADLACAKYVTVVPRSSSLVCVLKS